MTTRPHIASENLTPYAADATDSGVRHVRLFKNGANQAVRIPKEFELPGKDALMRREGNRLIIEVPSRPARGTAAALLAALDSMKGWEPVLEEFPDVNAGMLPLDDIEL